jgi:hypothetical protein
MENKDPRNKENKVPPRPQAEVGSQGPEGQNKIHFLRTLKYLNQGNNA